MTRTTRKRIWQFVGLALLAGLFPPMIFAFPFLFVAWRRETLQQHERVRTFLDRYQADQRTIALQQAARFGR